ncbi:hypothetical protein RSAG8_06126, partial [Rhizoctonia solani AG-8 WAC10335]
MEGWIVENQGIMVGPSLSCSVAKGQIRYGRLDRGKSGNNGRSKLELRWAGIVRLARCGISNRLSIRQLLSVTR